MKNVIADTGFWYSYLGTREVERHAKAQEIYDKLKEMSVQFIIPFPTLYETINTKLLREKYKKQAHWFLKQLNSNPNFKIMSDIDYNDIAYERTINNNSRGISLVDNIIRIMMEDQSKAKVDGVVTFNPGDFCDLCAKLNITMIDENYTFS